MQKKIPFHVKEHFQAHSASGKSIKEYSIDAGIPPQTFYTWRKKYRNQRSKKSTQRPSHSRAVRQRFSTVGTISLQELRQPLFDIHLATGHKVSIHRGTTIQEFAPFFELFSGGTRLC